jgi:hypothetical protein
LSAIQEDGKKEKRNVRTAFDSCLLRIQIQVDLPLIFQAVDDDSIAFTAGKIGCRST